MFFGGGFPFSDEGIHMSGGGGRAKARDVDTSKFYNLLEISKDASAADVKKAYRRLAIKHHPDKGGDPEVFKEISRAYEVLSDSEKRELYDKYGEEGLDGSAQSDPTDIFDLFFGGGGGTRRSKSGRKKGEDVKSTLKVGLDQIYNGTTRKLAINKDVLCPECKGIGGPADAMLTCESCNGQGLKILVRHMGPMIQQTQSICNACRGQGKMMPASKKCSKCTGVGTVKERKVLEVFVEKGIPNKHKIVFNGEADEKPGETAGDVVFEIEQQEHPIFRRRGCDLFIKKTISLYESLTGFTITLKHLDARELLIKNTPGHITKPNAILAVKDEGMPTHKNPFVKGNLFIQFDVEFPPDNHFDLAKVKKDLSKLLPPPTNPTINENDPNLEPHFTVLIDHERTRDTHGGSREAYHEDDDEEGGHEGAQKMQCRQQ